MNRDCTTEHPWRSQIAGCRGYCRGHWVRPFTQRPPVMEQPKIGGVLTAPSISIGITPASTSKPSPYTGFSELRRV